MLSSVVFNGLLRALIHRIKRIASCSHPSYSTDCFALSSVVLNGLLRASHSRNPTHYSHIELLAHLFYAHSVACQKVIKPLLCKHKWFMTFLHFNTIFYHSFVHLTIVVDNNLHTSSAIILIYIRIIDN